MPCTLSLICEDAGVRLDRFLGGVPEIPSRSAAQRLLREGHVYLNGERCQEVDLKLKPGDQVRVDVPEAQPAEVLPEPGDLEILHEDSTLIVLNKPAGLVVHPAPGHASGTLVNRLLAHCQDWSGVGGVIRPGIVHRLDKDTTGVLVVAKHDRAHQFLAEQFRKHTVKRQYRALVWGILTSGEGTVDAPLGRHPIRRKEIAVRAEGRAAVTHWRVLERLGGVTSVACRLETGRTHQIRVHFHHLGNPLVGDPQYRRSRTTHRARLHQEAQEALAGFPRQALHAELLGFIHPDSKEPLEFRTDLPQDFRELLDVLRRHHRPTS
ncbi:MAG: RluA family pseudouridine synthase [bacterium]|jgi:23S rRNA pseudouridine1911/1915/1917 synthase